MKSLVMMLSLAGAALSADPAGFHLWRGAELKAFEKKLAPKVNVQKISSEQLGKFGNHSFMVAHREGSGEAELHETQDDIFIVQSGEATLVVGGKVVGGKTTAAHEIRGTSVDGGEKKKLGAGDVLNIPAGTPHQLLVESGKQFTYMIVKVASAP